MKIGVIISSAVIYVWSIYLFVMINSDFLEVLYLLLGYIH